MTVGLENPKPANSISRMARVRAVENRRWVMRDTNNGITASIDPYGNACCALPDPDVRAAADAAL